MQFQGYQGMNGGALPPGILDTMTMGARIGAENIRSVGRSVGGMLDEITAKREARAEQEKNDAKMAKALRTIAPLMKDEKGNPYISSEVAATMSGKELQTALSGIVTASTLAERQAGMKEHLARLEQFNQAANNRRAAGAELYSGPMAKNAGLPFAEVAQRAAVAGNFDPDVTRSLGMMADLQPKAEGLGMGALSELGFIPTGGQVNPNGSASIQFGPKPNAPATEAVPITVNGRPTGKARLPDTGTVVDEPDPTKATQADQTFRVNVAELTSKLDQLEGLVNKYGNFEVMSPEAAAMLPQLQYSIAINYAKAVDPTSVAREGEVNAAQKYMLPMGMGTRNATTLAAIKNMRNEIQRRAKEYERTAIVPSGANTESAPIGSKSAEGKPLTREEAAALLKEAGGDRDKARALARERGFNF